jgi:hypothetical protein
METVDVFIDLYEQGWPAAQLQIEVYPREDQCFGPFGITATITFEDLNGDDHQIVDDARITELLTYIKKHDKDKWRDIERAAKLNSRPDYDEDYDDYEPSSYTPMMAEA